MAADPKKMTCAKFQTELSDLVASGEDYSLHPHLQTCERCRQLAVNLETISETVREMYPGEGPLIN